MQYRCNMKNALITGITGQDGAYLAQLLLSKGYKVFGAQRRNTGKRHWRLDELDVTDHIEFIDIDLSEPYNIENVIDKVKLKIGDLVDPKEPTPKKDAPAEKQETIKKYMDKMEFEKM